MNGCPKLVSRKSSLSLTFLNSRDSISQLPERSLKPNEKNLFERQNSSVKNSSTKVMSL